ncbi:hypothetical protein [Microvirga sp. 2TAF3]|uniref:hypothetical protein n=1 Tax=Microvirga sp. 2TAF3 TaxID=3233014 RepID=UPI003F9A95D5
MRSVVVALSLLIATSTGAFEPPRTDQAQAPSHNPLDCYCRAQGKTFALGATVCLRTTEGPKLAKCKMEINVTSWAFTETPCLDS